MSQSPSYQRDGASASPESPKEGDFSPRQLCDNLKSLEEHETCDDQKDPIVNIITDNRSSSPLNVQICAPLAANDLGKLCAGTLPQEQPIEKSHSREPGCSSESPLKEKPPVSPEFMEVVALDGRFITLVGTHAQTDWRWVEQSLSLSCQVQKEIEVPQLLQAEVESTDTVADSSEISQTRGKQAVRAAVHPPSAIQLPSTEEQEPDVHCVGPPRLLAYKPEQKQSSHVEKVPEVEYKQDVLLAQCEFCQQLFIYNELLENEAGFEGLFCCEKAKQLRDLLMGVREKLSRKMSYKKSDVNLHAPIMSEEERGAINDQAKERMRLLQLRRRTKRHLNIDLSHIMIKNRISYRLSKDVPYNYDEPPFPQMDIKSTTNLFTLQDETDGEPKIKEVIMKFYKDGQCFLTLCPDGTGNVFYPSGKTAITISSEGAADFTYIILEDKDVEPSIKGIFTNKGHATCYHPNGTMRLNLTPVGGLCFSETGALRRRWNWWYCDPHVHNLPFKPLTFALGPHIGVRIHTQERMYISFAHQQNSVRFNVGSKLKFIYPERYVKPGKGVLERDIQEKSSEIYSLLGQMQTCMSHPAASPSNIKPHYRFIAQRERLNRQMEKEKSPEKIKAHVN
ncbi:glutamate-rich protein 6-like [Sebastes umbrosus]|uniref:glutamate-rich protein 6-like n=1 Tax=Sebastes umbrosus TaxID=72105 RepID=UPI00189E6B63|nr:glutamate-rich protein 6-like [Sebastes umbrosus]